MKDYIIFWKIYSNFIYLEFGRLRTISIRDFEYVFIKGAFIFLLKKDLNINIFHLI